MTNTTSLYGRFATKFKIKKKNFYEMHVIIHVLIYLFIIIDVFWLLIMIFIITSISQWCAMLIFPKYIPGMDDSCDNRVVYIYYG